MHKHYHNRQVQSSLLAAPSAVGLDGNGITAGGDSTGTELAFNTLPGASGSNTAPPLQFGGSGLTVTATSPEGVLTPSSTSSGSSTVSNTHPKNIPISTVVAICVGTFVAAGLLICLGVMMYRRSSRKPSRARSPRSAGANGRDAWNRLGDDQDKWEGKAPTREVEKVELDASSGTLKKTPSRSVLAEEYLVTGDHSDAPLASFSSYHPKLAEELAQPPRAFMGHKEGLDSWDGSTVVTGRDDFSSLRSVRIESGTMSPSLSAAKMTPPSVVPGVHRWESAEVVRPSDRPILSEAAVNPFVDTPQEPFSRKSHSNPFFGAQGPRRPSIGRKTTQAPESLFDQPTTDSIPRILHVQNDSVTSNSSSAYGTDRAMQTLINALNLPHDEVEKRLRIASMQPSEMSRYSTLTAESLYGRESSVLPGPAEAR